MYLCVKLNELFRLRPKFFILFSHFLAAYWDTSDQAKMVADNNLNCSPVVNAPA